MTQHYDYSVCHSCNLGDESKRVSGGIAVIWVYEWRGALWCNKRQQFGCFGGEGAKIPCGNLHKYRKNSSGARKKKVSHVRKSREGGKKEGGKSRP